MAVEHLVKRTLYVAKCECGESKEVEKDPPRERRCSCGKWVPYEEISFTGPDTKYNYVGGDYKRR